MTGSTTQKEFELLRITHSVQIKDPPDFSVVENVRPVRLFSSFKRIPSAGTIFHKPVINTVSGKPDRLDYHFRAFPIPNTLYGAFPNFIPCLRADFLPFVFFMMKVFVIDYDQIYLCSDWHYKN